MLVIKLSLAVLKKRLPPTLPLLTEVVINSSNRWCSHIYIPGICQAF